MILSTYVYRHGLFFACLCFTLIIADESRMAYEFKCSNGQHIKAVLRCNGIVNCVDKSDELNCVCNGYKCHDGSCISITRLCNGIKDCNDGADEQCGMYN